jgi:hypothetical protein
MKLGRNADWVSVGVDIGKDGVRVRRDVFEHVVNS